MRIVVCIVVYDRFNNLKTWLNCWQQSNTENAELVIIHTGNEVEKFSNLCAENKIKYIHRENIGFDIGCLQDVCRQRLKGFQDYEYLLWCADDTLPMSKDFITPFINGFNNPKAGAVCMEISPSVSMHIRTTGFCIKKEVANKLSFPADPVITKQHCYLFEHRDYKKTFYNQIVSMGLIPVMVAPARTSPLWDQGYWRRLDRQTEHDKVFNTGKIVSDKVTFICPVYNTYPQIISSLILQTHENWELLLIHDGPNKTGIRKHINGDARIKYIETEKHEGKWGHHLRQWALSEIKEGRLSNPDYIVITNADNYHVPVYTEYLLQGFKKSHTAVASYCDQMVHSYKAWQIIQCSFKRGFIDCCGVMVKKDIACEIGWRDIESHSSDWTYFSDIAAKYSVSNFIRVKGCLITHN